ncbi:MAG: NAD(+) synthase [Tannerella sp.]|jgi:NAD+ synthase (glutamine-hydrolysing)|nr:NAD(+) synthase [Tannerella sp.]
MNGFVKVAAAAPVTEVANCTENIRRIEALMRIVDQQGVQIIVFPELCITGYTCMDLFMQQMLLEKAEDALLQLVEKTKELNPLCAVGMPLAAENKLFNTAVVFRKGRILGIVPKTFIPNYKEFQEMRWFSSGNKLQSDTIRIGNDMYPFGTDLLFSAKRFDCVHPSDTNPPPCDVAKNGGHPENNLTNEIVIGIELCEDLWSPVPPSSRQAMQGANIILNLSASNEIIGKNSYLRSLIAQQSARCMTGYVYAAAGFGESGTDMVFTGKGFIAENGSILSESERFNMDDKLVINDINIDYLQHDRLVNTGFTTPSQYEQAAKTRRISFDVAPYKGKFDRHIDPHPFVPSKGDMLKERCEEIFNIQTFGLIKRIGHIHTKSAVVGISGGLDSTLALMVSVRAFDMLNIPRKNILGVTMPGFGTTGRTYKNAVSLIEQLGVSFREISIKDACTQHFKDIGHDGETPDTTYENTQARERTQILMDLANMTNGLVIGTGDLSELALGWATFNGDHMSMYGVNAGIPKTLVRYLVEWSANNLSDKKTQKTLLDIANTPVSPELIPANADDTISQKTEDLVGPYELHDFFLYHFMRYGAPPEKILFLTKQAFGKKYEIPEIRKWLHTFLRRFFSQQFKRNCLPDGPKVGSICLSPRGDWRMPSDASSHLWLQDTP